MIESARFLAWIRELDEVFLRNRDYLTELDAAIGDADHGINMARGFTAAAKELSEDTPGDVGGILKRLALTLMKTVGGAAGPLYGTFFLKAATTCSGATSIGAEELVALFEAGLAGLRQRGKAKAGDKTMVDVWEPVILAMRSTLAGGGGVREILEAAVEAGESGRDATIPLVARKGRASYLGERSRGHQDPGATSSVLMLNAARETLA